MFIVVRTPHKTVGPVSDKKLGDIKERLERLEAPLPVYFRELDRDYSGNRGLSISHLASLSLSRLRLGLYLSVLCIAGVVASRAQWRLGIFAVGLQMAIKLSQF